MRKSGDEGGDHCHISKNKLILRYRCVERPDLLRVLNTWNHVLRTERNLLGLREVFVRILIQYHCSNILDGDLLLRDDFGCIQ